MPESSTIESPLTNQEIVELASGAAVATHIAAAVAAKVAATDRVSVHYHNGKSAPEPERKVL